MFPDLVLGNGTLAFRLVLSLILQELFELLFSARGYKGFLFDHVPLFTTYVGYSQCSMSMKIFDGLRASDLMLAG